MRVLYEWLKEFVECPATPGELRDRLSQVGVPVDAVEDSPAGPVLVADPTANRPDCLGHLGVAREVATLFRLPLQAPTVHLREAADATGAATRVEVTAPELCGRYVARLIRGVRVGPSPEWLRKRLLALGQNPVNNIVDATNYVLFELGHPLHAFDFDRLEGGRIVVRRARAGERIRTLDGTERTLSPETCVIADAARAVAIAGIMGGADTEIHWNTRTVLLESAWFDPASIRRSAKQLGLHTEASLRFGRGADPEMAELASRRCAALIQELAGGEILRAPLDLYPRPPRPVEIVLTRSELLRVLGADIPDADIEAILAYLGFAPRAVAPGRWQCQRPSWRQDVSREVDLIEEVARHYGYDRFPSRLPPTRVPPAESPAQQAEQQLRQRLLALGYQEFIAIPLVDPADDELFRPPQTEPVRLANPLSEEVSVLRSSGMVSLVHTLAWNLHRGQRNLRLYEIGRRYALSPSGQPLETTVLTLGLTGLAQEKSLYTPERAFSFADLKGDLESLAELAGGVAWLEGTPAWLHPGRSGRLRLLLDVCGAEIGVAGQLHPRLAGRWKLRQPVFVAELLLEPLLEAFERMRGRLRYRPIPKLPAVERDLSLVLDRHISFAQVRAAIEAAGVQALAAVEPRDLYEGSPIPEGKYSLLIRLRFQSSEATLTEAELNDYLSRILASLQQRVGATLRGPQTAS